MPRRIFFLPIVLLLAFAGKVNAQGDIRDTTIALIAMTPTYAFQLPSGDMEMRFGSNHNVGLSALRKTRSNYLFGIEGSFIFGNNVGEYGLMRGLITREGQIIDTEGEMSDIQLFERGYTIFLTGAKIIPVVGPNPNSGMLLKLGGGYMRHKIRIQTQKNEVPQLEGDYLEGYDRLTAGPAGMFFVGYQHFSNNRRINFHFGFEIMLGFTEPLRAYNFDTRTRDAGGRVDMLTGFRAGWTIPIYKRVDHRFHYN